ncbi:MAG: hypothetical protein MK102_06560 [Fuerstiella sp.]|nr:hypothetical protein [Fuerstiella sp.]
MHYLLIPAIIVLCVPAVSQASDATATWMDKPVVGNQMRFLGVTQLMEAERPFQRFRFQCGADFQECRIEAELPALIPVEEFLVRTRVNSTHAGLRLGVRIVLPGQTDPESNEPLTTWLFGERSTNASEWQTLKVGTPSEIDAEIFRVRSRLAPMRIDIEGLYIDRCALLAQFSGGSCVVDAEPVSYGPIVLRSASDDAGDAILSENSVPKRTGRLRVERNQVFLNGQRTLLQMMPDHGESLQTIRELGINTLWTQNQDSSERPRDLSDAGIIIAVTPPHPKFDPADFSRPLNGLMPLHHQMETADIFCLGNRVLPHQLPHLLAWARLVRSSDRILRRPILADVTASEGLASRQIDMVGIGVPSLHRYLTFGGFRNSILHKTRRASQMTLPWTWIQTESPGSMTRWRQTVGLEPLVVEPEQITMQVIAALSAGVRAIAFWKTQPFGGGQLQESESGLAVALSSLQIGLLEPWLVMGQAQSYIAVDDGRSSTRNGPGTKPMRFQAAVATSPVSLNPVESAIPRTPDAAVISGRDGSLMIVALWDDSSHYVPGQLYARKASLIATARETSSAAQITMTDVVGQPRNAQPGGLAVTLSDLDLFGVILVSSNPEIFGEMRRRVQFVAPRAAELKCAIARLKHQRVSETCANIDHVAPQAPPSASQWLVNATRMLKAAETAMQNDRFREADQQADGCLRALRAAQNLYWTTAIRQLPTPTASPYTVAFSSLPEHWQMMANIASAQPSDNLLPPGEFHHRQEMEQTGWTFPELTDNVYITRSRVRNDSQDNVGFLQLAAWKPENTQVPLSTQPSTLVNLPPVSVEAGDLVELRGQVRLSATAIRAVEEFPLMIFDSELGPEFAVRPALEADWRTFHMYRQAAVSGPLQFTLGLQGSAEVHVDLDTLVLRTVGRASSSDAKLRTARVPE